METLTIDVSKWRTGGVDVRNPNTTGVGPVRLLNKYGYMCCLGFECIRLGTTLDEIKYKCSPDMVITKADISELVHLSDYGNTEKEFSLKAIQINDDDSITLSERKEKISSHFSTIGVKVEFING